MNKKGLYITLVVAVVIFAIAYITGSVNKNNDEVLAENSNTNQQRYVTQIINNPSLTLQTPIGFMVCEQQSDFIEGIVAYIWSDGTCEHDGDAIDIQLFVFDEQGKDMETVLRENGKIFFDIYEGQPNIQVSNENEREIYTVKLDTDYLIAEKIGDKVVYIQSAVDSIGRAQNQDASDIIAETIEFTD